MMTKLLSDAFEQASHLPDQEQDALAQWLLQELKSEQRWDELLEGSADKLSELAAEARAEHRARRTRPLTKADF